MAVTPPPADWADLDRALDAFAESGRLATWWLRDDDATHPTPALERLLALDPEVPLVLAVIPARAQPSLAERLATAPHVRTCLHGWNHWNHAPDGTPKAELGPHRPASYVLGEIARGWMTLKRLLPDALAMLVPPHNRIAPAVATELRGAGIHALSTYGARRRVPQGIVQVNSHCDIMDWNTRAYIGDGLALGQIVAHLKARLDGSADPDEPTGVLSHHLAHDDAAWDFLARILVRLKSHRTARLLDPRDIFATAA
ncbi:MAG: hypothetical protein GC202_06635 [Alphaproteobacteria bacterium]|nr:hypothetical protein [Alphaproteobacteria bacterium]